jgi:osmotically-inducible protein OsmY
MKRLHALLLILPLLGLLGGCPVLLLGGGAAAVSAIEDRRTSGTIIDDDSIEVATRRTLRERFGENTHVSVTSLNRSVLLTGEVPDEARKAEVEKIVQGIANVRTVTNDLQIGVPSSLAARANDSLITARVKTRLLDASNVNPLHVKVVTESGVVYLMGIVTEQEANDAVEVARTTGSVIKVVKVFEYCRLGDGVCK